VLRIAKRKRFKLWFVCLVIVGQRIYYGDAPPASTLLSTEDEDLEQALTLEED
jgi:hypothetical protein